MIGGKYEGEQDACMGRYKSFAEWWLKIQCYVMACNFQLYHTLIESLL